MFKTVVLFDMSAAVFTGTSKRDISRCKTRHCRAGNLLFYRLVQSGGAVRYRCAMSPPGIH